MLAPVRNRQAWRGRLVKPSTVNIDRTNYPPLRGCLGAGFTSRLAPEGTVQKWVIKILHLFTPKPLQRINPYSHKRGLSVKLCLADEHSEQVQPAGRRERRCCLRNENSAARTVKKSRWERKCKIFLTSRALVPLKNSARTRKLSALPIRSRDPTTQLVSCLEAHMIAKCAVCSTLCCIVPVWVSIILRQRSSISYHVFHVRFNRRSCTFSGWT